MVVDVSSSELSSPRISFSHDLQEQDLVVPRVVLVESSTIDFEFCTSQVTLSSEQISSADELFEDGKILPKKSQETLTTRRQSDQPSSTKKKQLIEFLSTSSFDDEDDQYDRPISHRKSFWQFRRSSISVNSNSNSNPNNGLLRSSIHFLTRSNSTGSAPPSAKPAMHKQNSLKEASSVYRSNNNNNQYYHYYYDNVSSSKKPSLLKSTSSKSCNSNGVRINPVLNINPPAYIVKGTASLFGLRSILCTSNKSEKKRK